MVAKIRTGALVVAALWLLVNLFTGVWLSRFLFRTEGSAPAQAFSFSHPFEEVWLARPGGVRLHGLWFRRPDSSRGVVLYFHGNKGEVGRWGQLHEQFLRRGYDFALFDYRGFGRSGGTPHGRTTEADLLADALAIYDWAAARYAPHEIVLFGRSMGTAFATAVACRRPAAALVLEAPFRSVPELFRSWCKLPPSWFYFRFRLDTEALLPQLSVPLLILHGTEDELVPFAHGAHLASAKEEATFVPIPGGGHQHLWLFERYQQALDDFLGILEPMPPN